MADLQERSDFFDDFLNNLRSKKIYKKKKNWCQQRQLPKFWKEGKLAKKMLPMESFALWRKILENLVFASFLVPAGFCFNP